MEIKEKIKETICRFEVRVKELFLFDVPKRNFLELAIIILIIIGILYGWDAKFIVGIFLTWAILAFAGLFVPTSKIFYTTSVPGTEDMPKNMGIPMLIKLTSSGGFLANKEIDFLVEILDFKDNKGNVIRKKDEFYDLFEEFSVVYFNSMNLPIKMGGFIDDQPQAGAVSLIDKNNKFLKARTKILFNSLGDYYASIMYKSKTDKQPHHLELKNDKGWMMDSRISISPAESYVSIRNYSIMYALTVIILLLTLIQVKIIFIN